MTVALDNFKLAPLLKEDKVTAGSTAMAIADSVKLLVEEDRKARKINTNTSWDLYNGDHSRYFVRRKNEPNDVYEYRKEHAAILNYCEFITNLGAKYSYGRPEKVRREYSVEDKVKQTEDGMRRLERLIGIQQLMLTVKRHCGIFGDTTVRLCPFDERTNRQHLAKKATNTTYPKPVLLDNKLTFPLRNAFGTLDAIVIEGEYTDHLTQTTVSTLELVVDDSRWYFEDGALKNSEANKYALNEEFYQFINDDMRRNDYQRIEVLQIKIDEAWTDANHFFERHGWPQMVTKVDLSKVIHNPNYIWEVSPDSDNAKVKDEIDFLTWDGKMEEALKFIDMMESAILKLSSTAAIATGDLKSIGQLRSGAALVTAHGPSIQNATEKQVIWERNERGFFNALAMFDSRIRGEAVEKRYKGLSVQITFPNDFVPGEELVRAEIDSMAMNSHTTTIKEIARRKNPTAPESEIDAIREEIINDSNDLTDSKRAFVTEQVESGGQPVSSGKKKEKEQPKNN